MGKSKRKRGDPNGPAILSLAPMAQAASGKAATVVPGGAAASSTSQSAPKVDKPPLPIVNPSQGLRQYTAATAASQLQYLAGNQAGLLRVQYLAKIAEWAASTVPNLGAFFGQRLATASEALAVIPPTPHFLCQRCETVLQVGENCSMRVMKAPKRWRKAKAKGVDTGLTNALVYHCHFCKFENKKPGTARGYVKTKLSQSAARSQMNKLGTSYTSKATSSSAQKEGAANSKKPAATPAKTPAAAQSKNLPNNKIPVTDSLVGKGARVAAVSGPVGTALLPIASSPSSPSTPSSTLIATSGGKKRKRKGWSTLKEMASGQVEMPTPSRLGFMSPLNPSRKG